MKRRLKATRSVIALFAIGIVGCVHGPASVRQDRHVSYWEALAELTPPEAIASARTPSEKEFAEALENLMSGDLEKAEQRFGALRNSATDSIIRTGSSLTMLASDVAHDLNIAPIAPDTLEIVTSTGRISANPALIPELEIGQLVVRNAPAMVVEETMMQMSEPRTIEPTKHVKIDGIIGFDIIRQLDLEVDYGESSLRLRNPATSRPDADRNMFWVGIPVVRLTSTDGIPLHFGLDTGAQLTFVTETLLDKLELVAARIESRRVGGLGGEISVRAPVLPDLRVLVRGFPILFVGAVVRAPVYQVLAALDGVLGGDVWNSGIVRIDMTNGVFAIRRPRPN